MKYPSYCCQKCGELIGWLGRVMPFHKCKENNTHPPQRPWIGLTEQERNDMEDFCEMIIGKVAFDAIEAKLKAKNAY